MIQSPHGIGNSLNWQAKYPRRGRVIEAYPNVHIPAGNSSFTGSLGIARAYSTKSLLYGPGVTLPYDLIDYDTRHALQQIRRHEIKNEDEEDDLYKSYFDAQVTDRKACLTLTNYKGTGDGSVEAQINQDRAFVSRHTNAKWDCMVGVFDGHGNRGEEVAQYCFTEIMDLLPKKLPDRDVKDEEEEENVKHALINSFLEINYSLPTKAIGGSTASLVLQRRKKLYFANLGDSYTILASFNKLTKEVKIVFETHEDKCHDEGERARIEEKGGEVVFVNKEGEEPDSRVYYLDPSSEKKKSMGMSRSIGDWDAKPFGVIADPTVTIVELENTDNDEGEDLEYFIIAGSDGIFTFLKPHDVAVRISKSLYLEESENIHENHPLFAAEDVIVKAAQAWSLKYDGGRDDITIAFSAINC